MVTESPRGRPAIPIRGSSPLRTTSPIREVRHYSPTRHITHTSYDPVSGHAYTQTTYADPLPPVRPVSPIRRISPARKPILTPWNEDDLVHTLKRQCDLETELEQTKIMVANCGDFNL